MQKLADKFEYFDGSNLITFKFSVCLSSLVSPLSQSLERTDTHVGKHFKLVQIDITCRNVHVLLLLLRHLIKKKNVN